MSVDLNRLCLGCMKETLVNGVCTHCGFSRESYDEPAYVLKPGSILNGKYIVGKKIGEGGFGITYIGFELNLELIVAIKEYYPNGLVTRNISVSKRVEAFSQEKNEFFAEGRIKMINEAKTLAKFQNTAGVVSVRETFEENGTSYIVMEYIDGMTLSEYLDRNGGNLSVEETLRMFKPLIKLMKKIHETDLIHRDISPDNIMITREDKSLIIIDFGAARNILPGGKKSMTIQYKLGYAPEEQCRSHGVLGPWTDVYALCATMYKVITGKVPPEANDRREKDELRRISALGININHNIESAIFGGLAVMRNDRIQSMGELYELLYNSMSDDGGGGGNLPGDGGGGNLPGGGGGNIRGGRNGTDNGQDYTFIQIVLVVACTILLLLGIVVTILAIKVGAENKDNVLTDNPTTVEEIGDTVSEAKEMPEEAQESEEAAETVPEEKCEFKRIKASSELSPTNKDGSWIYYNAELATDGDYTTAWNCSRDDKKEPYITLEADSMQTVKGIKITNGYLKSEEIYYKNNRITKIKVKVSGKDAKSYALKADFMEMQTIVFEEPIKTDYITIYVTEVIEGSKWKDTAISEIEVF